MSINRRNFVKSLGALGILSTVNPTQSLAQHQEDKKFDFTSAPYLQNFTANDVTILATFSKPCIAWVEILDSNNEIKETVYQVEDGMRNANSTLFKFIVPHTNANFTYRIIAKEITTFQAYKIEYGQQIQSKNIQTELPFVKDGIVNLLILNDIHENKSTYGDLYKKSTLPRKDLVLLNGDSFHTVNSDTDVINKLNQPASEAFGSKTPFVVVRGNHETRGSLARDFKQYYDYPDNKFYQSFLIGSLFVIILDGGEDKPDSHPVYANTVDYDNYRLEQKEWLAKALTSPERKKAKHTIILNHIPWIHSDDWHGTQHNYECFHELTNKYKVDAVISGHTHQHGFHHPSKEHNYCVIIGGGPKVGERTFVEVSADNKKLAIALKKEDGALINSFTKN